MKQEEFMKLNKFNHLSQYTIDQVNTDLKKEKLFYERPQ
jgi:hypothetical protein